MASAWQPFILVILGLGIIFVLVRKSAFAPDSKNTHPTIPQHSRLFRVARFYLLLSSLCYVLLTLALCGDKNGGEGVFLFLILPVFFVSYPAYYVFDRCADHLYAAPPFLPAVLQIGSLILFVAVFIAIGLLSRPTNVPRKAIYALYVIWVIYTLFGFYNMLLLQPAIVALANAALFLAAIIILDRDSRARSRLAIHG